MEANTRQAYMGRFKAGQAKEGPHIEAIWAVQASFTDLCAYCFLSVCTVHKFCWGASIYIEESKCFFHEELTELYILIWLVGFSDILFLYVYIISNEIHHPTRKKGVCNMVKKDQDATFN